MVTASATGTSTKGLNPFLTGLVRADVLIGRKNTPRVWTLQNLLVKGSLAMLHGDEEMHKSWMVLDLAWSIAAGIPWVGYATTQSPVIVISYEMDEAELRERLVKQRTVTLKDYPTRVVEATENLHLLAEDSIPDGNLPQIVGHTNHVIDMIRHTNAQLIVFDPFNHLHEGGDTDAKEVAPLLAAFHRIRRSTGCSILFVHHNTKTGLSYRGSGRLSQDPRLRMEVTGTKEGMTRTLTFKKVSAGKKPSPVHFDRLTTGELQCTMGGARRFYAAIIQYPHATDKDRAAFAGIPEGSITKCRKQLIGLNLLSPDGLPL